jgi:hypothetical protein
MRPPALARFISPDSTFKQFTIMSHGRKNKIFSLLSKVDGYCTVYIHNFAHKGVKSAKYM